MKEIKEDWAKAIIGQALADIHRKEDIKRITKKVAGTAVGTRPDLMKVWSHLVKLKAKTL